MDGWREGGIHTYIHTYMQRQIDWTECVFVCVCIHVHAEMHMFVCIYITCSRSTVWGGAGVVLVEVEILKSQTSIQLIT
jgi:hypothetical protein